MMPAGVLSVFIQSGEICLRRERIRHRGSGGGNGYIYHEYARCGRSGNGKLCDKVYIMLDDEAVKMEDGGGSWIPDYDHMIACEIVYATGGYPDFAIIRAERKMEGRIALRCCPVKRCSVQIRCTRWDFREMATA